MIALAGMSCWPRSRPGAHQEPTWVQKDVQGMRGGRLRAHACGRLIEQGDVG